MKDTVSKNQLYIGLMSGTSVNSIDAALIDYSLPSPVLIATHEHAIPPDVRKKIIELCTPSTNEIEKFGNLNRALGILFSDATKELLTKANISPARVKAIGSHGQTIRHHPNGVNEEHGFSLQIGDPSTIAANTGITTVADFRNKDIALNGQGAPLTPALHANVFRDTENDRCIINIGGMANITFLPSERNTSEKSVFGFDTGPGNVLLDHWINRCENQPYDAGGKWASKGTVNHLFLNKMNSHPYFELHYPKSTGREDFNSNWLEEQLALLATDDSIAPIDVQTTLAELTATTISDALKKYCDNSKEIYICGGGVHNLYLMERIRANLPDKKLGTTEELGVHPDWVEACAFAWFAKQTMERHTSNLPEVTGASRTAILGGIFYP